MRVVVNQLAALGRKTGIGHYTGQLLRCLRALAPEGEVHRFPAGGVRRVCRVFVRARPYLDTGLLHRRRGGAGSSRRLAHARQAVIRSLRQGGRAAVAWYFRSVCARARYDLYHEPNLIPLPCDRPTVATLHDLSVLLHPEWHPADRVAYYEQNFVQATANCVHFLVVSDFIRQEVIRTLGVAPERVTRTYNGIRPGFRPLPEAETAAVLRRLGLPPRYLLYLGTIEPRKNVLRLLQAYCGLPAAVRDRWPLLLVGNWGWNAQRVAEYLHDEARHRGVLHLGYVRERHLAAVYNGARALVYPSCYEGFGLPPLEMMACGGAVLASTAGAVAETVGRQAHAVAPEDVDGWRDAMARVVADDDWWCDLRRGARAVARPYTWERCAAETLAVYRRICGLPAAAPADGDRPTYRAAG